MLFRALCRWPRLDLALSGEVAFLSQKPGWALHCIESGVPAEGSEESRLIFICLCLVLGAGRWQWQWHAPAGLAWPGLLSREGRVPVADSASRTVCGSGEGGVQPGGPEGEGAMGGGRGGGVVVQSKPNSQLEFAVCFASGETGVAVDWIWAVPDTFFGRQGWSRELSVTFLGALD